jgi:hypothetical protein
MKLLKFTLLVTIAVAFASCKKQPVAGFTTNTEDVETYQEITFTNTTEDGVTYLWDFGDGKTSTEESPKHTYVGDATSSFFFIYETYYEVSLTAFSKKEKKEDTFTKTLYVKDVRDKFVGDYLGTETQTIGSTTNKYVRTADVNSANDPQKITISGYGFSVTATVTGSTFVIPTQNITDNFTSGSIISVSGSGTLSGNVFSYSFSGTSTDGKSVVVSFTGTK